MPLLQLLWGFLIFIANALEIMLSKGVNIETWKTRTQRKLDLFCFLEITGFHIELISGMVIYIDGMIMRMG
jgi:hypothetical protein